MTPPLKIYPCPVCSHTMAGWPGTSQVRLAVPALTRGVRSGKFSFWDCCNHAEAVLKQFEYGDRYGRVPHPGVERRGGAPAGHGRGIAVTIIRRASPRPPGTAGNFTMSIVPKRNITTIYDGQLAEKAEDPRAIQIRIPHGPLVWKLDAIGGVLKAIQEAHRDEISDRAWAAISRARDNLAEAQLEPLKPTPWLSADKPGLPPA